MDEIIYKDNKIVCFSSNDFQAFVMNQDGDIESGTFCKKRCTTFFYFI